MGIKTLLTLQFCPAIIIGQIELVKLANRTTVRKGKLQADSICYDNVAEHFFY